MTGRAHVDLAIWMTGLGVVMGVGFPFAIVVLGVPAHLTLRASFFAATVGAGLIVGTGNFFFARRVVAARERQC